jgi:hypothetical protein
VVTTETPYRYLVQLVPQRNADAALADSSGGGATQPEEWELVSSRVTGDGDELSVFRRPA